MNLKNLKIFKNLNGEKERNQEQQDKLTKILLYFPFVS